jgi:tellurite resistance protein TerC
VDVSPLVWTITLVVTIGLLVVDVFIIGRRPHEPSTREVTISLAFFIGLAVVFGIGVWAFAGGRYGGEFFAGWLTEYSLSVDNLFVFIIIMTKLKVPRQYQQTALLIGIVIALVMRGIFIGVGAAAINQFSWVFYLFGLFLVWTAYKLAKDDDMDGEHYDQPRIVTYAQTHLPVTDKWNGVKMSVKENGKRLYTPMFIVVLSLGMTDLLFALDSIPAIYGLTREPYLVFTANIFALMGLRQLYFLIGDLLKRLVYLSYGLAVLLAFIGVKLILHWGHEDISTAVPEISTQVSLGVIIGVLVIVTVASLVKTRNDPTLTAHAGSLKAHKPAPAEERE